MKTEYAWTDLWPGFVQFAQALSRVFCHDRASKQTLVGLGIYFHQLDMVS